MDSAGGGDLYIVRMGEGDDFIRDICGDTETIQFDVASNAVTFVQDALDTDNLHVIMADVTDIEIANFLCNNDYVIEQIQFTDVTLTATEARLRAFVDPATAGGDHFIGGEEPDTLRGGFGDDYLSGGSDLDVIAYPGTQDQTGCAPSQGQGFLVTFANDAGSIRVSAGLCESSGDILAEFVDSDTRFTKVVLALVADIAVGSTVLEGPSTGGKTFPAEAEFILSQSGDDIY